MAEEVQSAANKRKYDHQTVPQEIAAARLFNNIHEKRPRGDNSSDERQKPLFSFVTPLSMPVSLSKKINIPNGKAGVEGYSQSLTGRQVGSEQFVMTVPNNKVGRIMGKAGETIKNMQARSRLRIQAEAGVSGTGSSSRLTGQQVGSEQFLIKVPYNKVGRIIGKEGATIENLRARSGARINLVRLCLDPSDKPTERTFQIDGTSEQVEAAKQLVYELAIEGQAGAGGFSRKLTGQQAGSEQFIKEAPNNKVGHVIGKGGETIESMQARPGLNIQAIPLHLPPGDTTEGAVQIDGTSEQTEATKQLVYDVTTEVVSRHKGDTSKRKTSASKDDAREEGRVGVGDSSSHVRAEEAQLLHFEGEHVGLPIPPYDVHGVPLLGGSSVGSSVKGASGGDSFPISGHVGKQICMCKSDDATGADGVVAKDKVDDKKESVEEDGKGEDGKEDGEESSKDKQLVGRLPDSMQRQLAKGLHPPQEQERSMIPQVGGVLAFFGFTGTTSTFGSTSSVGSISGHVGVLGESGRVVGGGGDTKAVVPNVILLRAPPFDASSTGGGITRIQGAQSSVGITSTPNPSGACLIGGDVVRVVTTGPDVGVVPSPSLMPPILPEAFGEGAGWRGLKCPAADGPVLEMVYKHYPCTLLPFVGVAVSFSSYYASILASIVRVLCSTTVVNVGEGWFNAVDQGIGALKSIMKLELGWLESRLAAVRSHFYLAQMELEEVGLHKRIAELHREAADCEAHLKEVQRTEERIRSSCTLRLSSNSSAGTGLFPVEEIAPLLSSS